MSDVRVQEQEEKDLVGAAFPIPAVSLSTGNATLDQAFRLALGDIVGNIVPFQDGLLTHKQGVLLAGLDYDTPWTRDAAINIWNGAGLLLPQIGVNTLLAVLEREGGTLLIGGQYWDALLWASGAWWQYLYTGERAFLALAFEATYNTLARMESQELDRELHLFRGPACYGDGVAAYPDIYARTNGSASILDWPAHNPQLVSHPGYGLPMHTLSTNCMYYATYLVLEGMAQELGMPPDPAWREKAQALKQAIQTHFWDDVKGQYRYLIDPFGRSDRQEGLGHAFALLFGIATQEQALAILHNQHATPQGIPCLWPPFERYGDPTLTRVGRHCGTIWPHIQGFWAQATAQYGAHELFSHELYRLAANACNSNQFAEVYHPLTGEPYGGIQEGIVGQPQEYIEWKSCVRQSWSATGYLRMILLGLLGMSFTPSGITLKPVVPAQLHAIALRNLPYRQMVLDIEVHGSGTRIAACTINELPVSPPFVPASGQGRQSIVLIVET